MVICAGLETAYWACDDPWELGVLLVSPILVVSTSRSTNSRATAYVDRMEDSPLRHMGIAQ